MLEQIKCFLEDRGYVGLDSKREDFLIYFRLENGYVNAVHVLDCDQMNEPSREAIEKMTRPIQWQFGDGAVAEVHMLSLLLGGADRIRNMIEYTVDNGFCWFIDTGKKELIVPDDRVENFYGLRGKLTNCLEVPFDVEAYRQKQIVEETAEAGESKKSFLQQFFSGAVVNHFILLLNVILFIACLFTGETLYEYGSMNAPSVIEQGEWYRMISAIFLHADVAHLTSNMLLLYLLGDIVERLMGHCKYFILYMGAGLLGGTVSLFYEFTRMSFVGSIGASGAIYGIVGAMLWILIRNHGRIEEITIPKLLFIAGYSLYHGFVSTNIDNAAHVGGLISGFLLSILLYHKHKRQSDKMQKGNANED